MIGLSISFHRFYNESGCVFRRQARRILRHSMEFDRIRGEFPDSPGEQVARKIGLLQNDTGLGAGENLGVSGLMVLRSIGKGNQESGQRKGGELRETGGPPPGDREIRSAIDFLHCVMKRRDKGGDSFPLIIVGHEPFLPRSGKMDHLDRNSLQRRQRPYHCLIDASCSLASTHHQKRKKIFLETKPLPRDFLIEALKFLPDWSPSHFRADFGEKRSAFLASKQNGPHHSRRKPVSLPGNRIGFVNESRNPSHLSRQHRCSGGETTHPKDNVRFEFPVDATAKRKTFAEAAEESEHRGRKRRRETNRGQFMELEIGFAGERKRVDLLFGNEEHHLVATGAQDFRDRQSGKQMSACSSTCDYGIHGLGPIEPMGLIFWASFAP